MSTKSGEAQKTSDNAGGKSTRDLSLQHKTFSALNYAQDFGTTVKKSRNSKWATLTKSRIVPCQLLSCLCQQSQLSLPSVQTVARKDEGLNRELLTCLTIRSESTQNKAGSYHQWHWTMSCYLLSF